MKVNKALVAVVVLLLSGCATPPQFLANMYDRADQCQHKADPTKPLGLQTPSWCGAGGSTGTVRDYYTGRYIYRTK
jgi:starvation-inducible outer membrane lipoprotein